MKESSSAVETRGKARQDHTSQKNVHPNQEEEKPGPKRLKKGGGDDAPTTGRRSKRSEADLNEPPNSNGGDDEEQEEQQKRGDRKDLQHDQRKGGRKKSKKEKPEESEDEREVSDQDEKQQQGQKRGGRRKSTKGKSEDSEDEGDMSEEDKRVQAQGQKKSGRRKSTKEKHDEGEEEEDTAEGDDSPSVTAEDVAEFVQELKKNVSVKELKAFVEENDMDSSGTDEQLYDRSADALLFGPCQSCPSCGGVLQYAGPVYRCIGYISEWSKCNFSSRDDVRKPEKCRIPASVKNEFLRKWLETHEPVPRPLTPKDKFLSGLTLALSGRMAYSHRQMKEAIEKYGGTVANAVRPGVSALISPESEMSGGGTSKTLEASEHGIPIVREDWLEDCIEKGRALPLQAYSMSAEITGKGDVIPWDQRPAEEEAAVSLMMEIKMVGKRGVYADTKLEEKGGKIYEANDIIYNCAFTMCDITPNYNQYAIMQLIEVDGTKTGDGKGQKIYLYFKEGRVGDMKSSQERLDIQKSPEAAVEEFVKLFEDVTGNSFEPWEREKVLVKKCGKNFPIDMAPGVDARAGALGARQLGIAAAHCHLDSRVVEFLKALFSQTVYRCALTELGHDAPDLPIGILTDWHIDFCRNVLDEFAENLKKAESEKDEKKKAIVCLDFSNKWFSLLHSTRPLIIKDFVAGALLASTALECVRDISFASRLIGDMSSGGTLDDPISDRYKAMGCEMTALDRDGDEYKMIEKYFSKTIEPLKEEDGEYNCMIEDIVSVCSKASPSMEEMKKMPNKVLLWCGMRSSSLLAALSRGMQPTLFEAPGVPYYSFGRGICCSDAASDAAKFGFTSVERADGFLVLAVASLGKDILELPAPEKDVREYEKAGKSIKALGLRTPNKEEHFKWKKDITVPCGTLKNSNVKGAVLPYNEYIVYNQKQVMPVFLVKIRFEGIVTMEE